MPRYLVAHTDVFAQGNLKDGDLKLAYSKAFADWTAFDFEYYRVEDLTRLRRILRENGVTVKPGRLKGEIAKSLAAAIRPIRTKLKSRSSEVARDQASQSK
ncbi:BgTH12-00771 [Blumeria graminis f. sp. triticale]|uniref:BgTH12-00771 n=1 Tax=Blumeria graminis f. sp. triticale TaxID=1689686 RepID=A0A9W4D746_BLUGR|nr:BgTH12-00771 [Blumeria graminis f. sp. triticale]